MNRLAIFDCDGTLVDSGAAIHAAVRETFVEHGLAVPPSTASRRVIGLSLTEAMAALAPRSNAAEHARLTDTYKAKFAQARREGRVDEPLFDGIAGLLAHEKVYAFRYAGKRYDCGSKEGFLQANVELALANAELGPDFRAYLKSLAL